MVGGLVRAVDEIKAFMFSSIETVSAERARLADMQRLQNEAEQRQVQHRQAAEALRLQEQEEAERAKEAFENLDSSLYNVELEWSSGEKYKGGWKDRKRNGKGKNTYSNSDVYDGDWKDNKRHGFGSMICYKPNCPDVIEWSYWYEGTLVFSTDFFKSFFSCRECCSSEEVDDEVVWRPPSRFSGDEYRRSIEILQEQEEAPLFVSATVSVCRSERAKETFENLDSSLHNVELEWSSGEKYKGGWIVFFTDFFKSFFSCRECCSKEG